MQEFGPIFARYLLWSLQAMLLPANLIITIFLAANLGAAAFFSWRFRRLYCRADSAWIFLQFLFVPALIALAAIGTAGAYTPEHFDSQRRLAAWIVHSMQFAALCVGVVSIYRMKGLRWLAASVFLLQLWLMQSAGWIAGMAISGDWI